MAELKDIRGVPTRISATRWRMTLLAVAKAYWPFILIVSIFLIAALLGVWEFGSAKLGALMTLVFWIGAIVSFVLGWRRYEHPAYLEAQDALDRQSELRPLTSLTDRPADPNPNAQTLWDAHQIRLAREAKRLRVPSFSAAWKKLDPYFFRVGIPAVLGGLLIFMWPSASNRISGALNPDYGSLMGADDLLIEAWVTPPTYSGRAPIFLTVDMNELRVPAGSEVTLRAQSRSAPKLDVRADEGQTRRKFEETPDGAYEAKAVLTADSRVAVRWWGERQVWQINVEPDDAPTAKFVEVPKLEGKDQTVFTWVAADDYGIDRAELSFRLTNPHEAAPDEEARVPVPIPGVLPREIGSEDEAEDATLDLTRHKWAGLEVITCIVAIDGAGQESACTEEDAHTFIMPDKLLLQPLAKAIQESRVTVLREPRSYAEIEFNADTIRQGTISEAHINQLENAPEDIRRAALMLDAITYEGPRYFKDYSLYLALRNARGILGTAPNRTEANTVDSILWAAALKAEYGSAADALAALLAAKKALEKALRDGASEEEIARLTQAFREAAENYLAAKLAEAVANGIPQGQSNEDGELGESGQGLGSNSFEDMLNALEDLTDTGASDQARQLLSDITNMLENLDFESGSGSGSDGFPLPGQDGGEEGEQDDAPPEEQELSRTMERLSELLREQRQLNDDTIEQGRDGQPGQQNQPGQPGQQSGNQSGQQPGSEQGQQAENGGEPGSERLGEGQGNAGGGSDPRSLAERQQALRELLEELTEQAENGLGAGEEGEEGEGGSAFGDLDTDTLDDIGEAQRRAEEALREGRQRFAERNQEQATRMLRDLTGELAEALDELREARLGDESGQAQRTDPFGNPIGGANDGSDVAVPDAIERQRAKDILDELRRRYGDAIEEEEREYLERLLDRF